MEGERGIVTEDKYWCSDDIFRTVQVLTTGVCKWTVQVFHELLAMSLNTR